ncbi:hypothetical protein B7486_23925 [cyanobacterium TDX16]|nr:hypothetical protein B7486_23925 [cyanobacterium TDX16]
MTDQPHKAARTIRARLALSSIVRYSTLAVLAVTISAWFVTLRWNVIYTGDSGVLILAHGDVRGIVAPKESRNYGRSRMWTVGWWIEPTTSSLLDRLKPLLLFVKGPDLPFRYPGQYFAREPNTGKEVMLPARGLSIPLWLPIMTLAALAFLSWYSRIKPFVRWPKPCCQHCGYDLRGSVGQLCSECGTPILDIQKRAIVSCG